MNPLFISVSFVQKRTIKNHFQLSQICHTSQDKEAEEHLWKWMRIYLTLMSVYG